ncbi:hypothetical protein VTN77DRAFT_5868 [Rasamsonia byssochlamydoides]|uniref:uncharacterized protein n=1 Tax=Rasamsonia byssochlamydoides TaxID=89139 RepID=UPI0037433C41
MASQGVCYEFARTGTCKYKKCKFLHVSNGQNPINSTNQAHRQENKVKPDAKNGVLSNTERAFRAWRNNIPLDQTAVRPLGAGLGFFFTEARRLIEIDVNILQEVVRNLASEGGLRRIRELTEQDFDNMSPTSKNTTFEHLMLPFLETIAHPNVLASLVLEQAVGTIYNFLFGIAGRRAIRLLTYLADVLTATTSTGETFVRQLEVALLVFSQIVDLNSAAFIQEPLQLLAITFEDLFAALDAFDASTLLHQARTHLERLKRRLDIGSSLPTALQSPRAGQQDPVARFVTPRELPGGRHDNDHADICNINIMPTSQEISCSQTEYLPVKDPAEWHVGGIDGLLDRNFRLLREDTVGQLRDAIHAVLQPSGRSDGQKNQGVRTYLYHQVSVVGLNLDRSGFQFEIEFPQPLHVQKMTAKQRQEWWQLSKRLQADALVCLSDLQSSVVFCTVLGLQTRKQKEGQEQKRRDPASLWQNDKMASAVLRLVEPNDDSIQYILDHHSKKKAARTLSLVEFPGVLLPSFQPTLLALQEIKRAGDLPFSDLLAPSDPDISHCVDVAPPAYALTAGFSFSLRCLMDHDVDLEIRPGQPVDIKKLQENSSLDDAQAVGLVNTLQRKIGLIQGPPGTGKSYTGVALIKVLLANKHKVKGGLGPVICVCYTNHALDQLLEDLLEKKITSQIIRIGSRSQSEKLEPLNLRSVSQRIEKTKFEKYEQYRLLRELDQCEEEFSGLLAEDSGARIRDYLEQYHPMHYSQLFGEDDEGYTKVGVDNPRGLLNQWLGSGKKTNNTPRLLADLEKVDIYQMSWQERQLLYQNWLEETRKHIPTQVRRIHASHVALKAGFDKVRDELDLRCLRDADVVGVTTTGLARNLNMLRRLRSKVVLCEEAGEVIEAHLLTALLPSVEHAILIGDHLQLPPRIQNYELSRENPRGGEQYSLDVSLFERLVEPESAIGARIAYSTLETQRRMHPSISQLVRDTLYPQLQDAPSVSDYPEVAGMRARLFWLDHRQPEASKANNDAMATSFWNDYEVEMTTALVNHLIRQGKYQSGDIAVLTPYLGQFHRLRQRLGESFAIVVSERDQDDLDKAGFDTDDAQANNNISRATLLQGLRIATVDNFQGEEAKVVVISLVRSNDQNRCGFLRTSNRINVLLSRAQHGMYIIGNSETSSHVPMWAQVIDILQKGSNFGTSLELKCPRHPDTPIAVSEPDHFAQFSPEGGCNLRCVNRLPCGHACHERNVAIRVRSVAAIHVRKNVEKVVPGCQHKVTTSCHIDVNAPEYKCKARCVAHLPCGHACKRQCVQCTVCGSDEVKDSEVDFILGQTYREIDLNANPCIFPQCGHFLTMESMDAQMDLKKHYVVDAEEKPIEIAASSLPFSMDDIKTCATCRGPLREIARYGRLVRRALLDESTKKFILYVNREYVPLFQDVSSQIQLLHESDGKAAQRLFQSTITIRIEGPREHQIRTMHKLLSEHDKARWSAVMELRSRLAEYRKKVAIEEQPFNRVRNMVENVRRRKKKGARPFDFDESVLQTKGFILAMALILRLDTALLADFVCLRQRANKGELCLDLRKNRHECQQLIDSAANSQRVLQEAEGYTFLARLYALERSYGAVPAVAEDYLQRGRAAIEEARRLCDAHPNATRGLTDEIDGTEKMLNGSTFYTAVTSEERMAVVAAMAREFHGTGHWYYCQNGHPFTIGECGGAMQLSTCPECGAPVGGQHHQTVAGVTRASDLEEGLERMTI